MSSSRRLSISALVPWSLWWCGSKGPWAAPPVSRPGPFCPIRLNNEPKHWSLPRPQPGVNRGDRQQSTERNEGALDGRRVRRVLSEKWKSRWRQDKEYVLWWERWLRLQQIWCAAASHCSPGQSGSHSWRETGSQLLQDTHTHYIIRSTHWCQCI